MKKLLAGLAVAFALPWLFLVIVPFLDMSQVEPVPYSEEDGAEGLAAWPDRTLLRHGSSDYGAQVYAAEGCAYCHTQMVRPTYAGPDMWREGWGGKDADSARETRPEDYYGETVAQLGYARIGPDLSNVGHRVADRKEMHRHLIDPKSFDPQSGMPAYRHLYEKDHETGEYLPTGRAEALVDYLMSRRKDSKIPIAAK